MQSTQSARNALIRDAARVIAIAAVIVIAVALMFAAQQTVNGRLEGRTVSFARQLSRELLFWAVWAALLPFIVLFGRRFRVRSATDWRRMLIWLAAGVIFCIAHTAILLQIEYQIAWFAAVPPPGKPTGMWYAVYVFSVTAIATLLLDFAIIAVSYHAVVYAADARARALREAALTTRLAGAELDVLRMQLQPHFFFNTLNTVSALMERDVHGARRVLSDLSELLRISLDRIKEPEIQLADELSFLERYLDIQRTRYRDRMRVSIHVPADIAQALVPNLLLQPIIENAIRHGIEPRRSAGSISIRASRARNRLRIAISDDGPGFASGFVEGLGLRNTRERLQQLYGDDQSFTFQNLADGGCDVIVEMPFRTDASDPARAPDVA